MADQLTDRDALPDYPHRIKRLRAELGMTQVRLAAELGVSFATVNRWENGQAKPSQLSWSQIVRLNVDRTPTSESVRADAAAAPRAEASDLLDFTTPAEVVRVLAEGERLSFGHMANPAFAAETSEIDPLPHQRLAVYEHMVPQNRLRLSLIHI